MLNQPIMAFQVDHLLNEFQVYFVSFSESLDMDAGEVKYFIGKLLRRANPIHRNIQAAPIERLLLRSVFPFVVLQLIFLVSNFNLCQLALFESLASCSA